MKKLFLTIALLFITVSATFAQNIEFIEAGDEIEFNNNEVYLSCGTTSLVSLSGSLLAFMLSLGNIDAEPSKGTVSGGYNFYFNEHFAVGGNVTYEKLLGSPSLSFQAKGTAQYGWDHFKFYHALSLGVLNLNGKCYPILDVIPLGMKLDYTDFSIFMESSIISTGLLKIGASYKF